MGLDVILTKNNNDFVGFVMAQRLYKLHRSCKHRMIAGVMGGIAEYFGVSVMMVRILFVGISILSVAVPGVLIYFILWIIMPKATASSYVMT